MNVSTVSPKFLKIALWFTLAIALMTLSVLMNLSSQELSTSLFIQAEQVTQTEPVTSEELFYILTPEVTHTLHINMQKKGFLHLVRSDKRVQRKYWLQEGKNALDLSHVPPGIYMIWSSHWQKKTVEKIVISPTI